ncbi:hypothetical protein [uncultured Clostridium sp.]|jgi:hypothetical protein|uniref:hypothetical protein n=1 Tax=uncultured Clostridium sp. TaxID=59620 RepID=UPI00260A8167|nr:hypothetical protein [uncultured Clostridium sp.]
MWVHLKSTNINVANDNIFYSFFVSDDITELIVKVGGTEQSFSKKENEDFIDITVPIAASKNISTQIIFDSDILLEIFSAPFGKIDVTDNIISSKCEVLKLIPSLESIKILTSQTPISVDVLEELVEIETIYKPIAVKISTEYDRGLNDGLVLGQMI